MRGRLRLLELLHLALIVRDSLEEQDVWLLLMDFVVLPSKTLCDA